MQTGFSLNPRRVRSGICGDTAIILCRGLAGKGREHVRNVRSLRLHKIGDVAIGYSSDASFIGKYRKSQHLLALQRIPEQVVPKTVGGGRAISVQVIGPDDLRSGAGGMVKRHVPYPERPSDLVGNFFELGNDEYLQVEVDNRSASVLWSADEGVQTAFSIATEILGPASTERGLFVVDGLPSELRNSRRITETVLGGRVTPDLVVVGLRDAMFSWRRKQRKMKYSELQHIECGISAENVPINRIHEVVQLLGTASVKEFMATDEHLLEKALGSHLVLRRR